MGMRERFVFGVPFYRGEEDWHPIMDNLPLHLHSLKKRPTPESLEMLVASCIRAKIRYFARMDDNLVFPIMRLERYLRGQAEWNSTYTHDRS